ncbi:MAG: FHA domain-containing protein [Leptospiraceae bacterium]|nr:FHA domain-containing protein [Leptospiraceae bacterium]
MKKISLAYEKNHYALEDALTLGRDSENDIVIPEGLISRKHCKIVRNDLKVSIEDLESSNGTFLLLGNGDLIPITGKKEFEVTMHTPHKILLGKSAEVEFYYPDIKTINNTDELAPLSLGLVKSPGKLSIENVKLISKIYPNAGAVMIRRMLEILLYSKISQDDLRDASDLYSMISIVKGKFQLDDEIGRAMYGIRKQGNAGAHKDNVSLKSVEESIVWFAKIENALKK